MIIFHSFSAMLCGICTGVGFGWTKEGEDLKRIICDHCAAHGLPPIPYTELTS